MVDEINKHDVLEAALRRWYQSPESKRRQLVLRGSFLTAVWVGRHRRSADDLDFLSYGEIDMDAIASEWRTVLASNLQDGVQFETDTLQSSLIFADTEFPGVRLVVHANASQWSGALQIDIAFGDPLPFGRVEIDIPTASQPIRVLAPEPEVGFAWKLHGLVEKDGHQWRTKDLVDLWLMIQHVEMKQTRLSEAIRIAFESRDGPIWRLDRVVSKQLGKSTRSRREWRKYREANPASEIPKSIDLAVACVAEYVHAYWQSLRKKPVTFAIAPTRVELQALVHECDAIREYSWGADGSTFVYERPTKKSFPDPLHAATNQEFRSRLLLRETRGGTFHKDGHLASRPYPVFERFDESQLAILEGCIAFEKLDGSLVYPTPIAPVAATKESPAWRLRTRRGLSEISTQAERFANSTDSDYVGCIDYCLLRHWTPMFEWCSRQRPIVFDHPVDRLVLTGIRINETGVLIEPSDLEKVAARFEVETVRCLGVIKDPSEWYQDVRRWIDREGAVVHMADGRLLKIKSDRYRLLHNAIEGPNKDRARWQLTLDGASQQLCDCSQLRGLDLGEYVEQIEERIAKMVSRIGRELEAVTANDDTSRKQLTKNLMGTPAIYRAMTYSAYDGGSIRLAVVHGIRNACQNESQFQKMMRVICGASGGDA